MPKKLTLQQKADKRAKQLAETPVIRTGDRLGNALAALQRELGTDGSVLSVEDVPTLSTWPRRSTGIPSVDYLLSGGLPMGGQVEFGGPMSVGKSLIAMHAIKRAQRTEKLPCLWVAMEPFSSKWARTVGIWCPFNEREMPNPETGKQEPQDPYSKATDVELARMAEMGIEDPYGWNGYPPLVIMTGMFGDAVLSAVNKAVHQNEWAIIAVDSLAMMKSEEWHSEKDVRDASDFDRSIKLIADYTIRNQVIQNCRYDENNNPAPQTGQYPNQTTIINIQQISTKIGGMSYSPWDQFTIKGGEGSKHNHLSINAFLQGPPEFDPPEGKDKRRVGHTIKMKNLKSKIGRPYRDSEVKFYTEASGSFMPGDIDVAGDCVKLGLVFGVIEKSGTWLNVAGTQLGQGAAQAANFLRENPEWLEYMLQTLAWHVRQ